MSLGALARAASSPLVETKQIAKKYPSDRQGESWQEVHGPEHMVREKWMWTLGMDTGLAPKYLGEVGEAATWDQPSSHW